MKKLVAIALIAAMASVANGAGTIGLYVQDWNGTDDFNPGDVLTIQLKNMDEVCNGFSLYTVSDGAGGGAASTPLTMGSGLTTILAGSISNTDPDGTHAGVLINDVSAYATTNALPSGSILFSFVYTIDSGIDSPTTITLAPLASGTLFWYMDGESKLEWNADPSVGDLKAVTTPIDGVSFDVVPEPMTLGLLGLGGLFLRRRLA
jgi:hypothetical protein